MNTKLIIVVFLLTCCGILTGYAQAVKDILKKPVNVSTPRTLTKKVDQSMMNSRPMYGFIENKGQILDQNRRQNDAVKFLLPLPGNNVVLRSSGFSYDTYVMEVKGNKKSKNRRPLPTPFDLKEKDVTYTYHRVDIDFVGANRNVEIIAEGMSEDYINYFAVLDNRNEESVAHHYRKVTYKNIYPNIDVEFIARAGTEKPVEYNFIVNPGGDVRKIQMRYVGANEIRISDEKVELSLVNGKMYETIPSSYWKDSGKKVKIGYKRIQSASRKEAIVGLSSDLGVVTKQLIIDPAPVLLWETGITVAASNDDLYDVFVSSSESIYMVGMCYFNGLPIATSGAHQTTVQGVMDGVLLKYNSSGVLQWATYYGGSGWDSFHGIKETPLGQLQILCWGDTNGTSFVKFTPAGAFVSVSYFGGLSTIPYSLYIDQLGNSYVTGYTTAAPSIITPGAYQKVMNGSWDAYVVKFNSSLVLQWGTYLGGNGYDTGNSVIVDNSGNVYVTGFTSSADSIATAGAHMTTYGGGTYDVFLNKFSSSGVLQWGTYFGGSQTEQGMDLALDSDNNIYITGYTESDSIATAGAYQTTLSGSRDGFLVKFNPLGQRQWSTYHPEGNATSLAIDSYDRIFFTGQTDGVNLPNQNAFVSEVTASGGHISTTLYNRAAPPGYISWEFPKRLCLTENSIYVGGFSNGISGGPTFREFFLAKFSQPCVPSAPMELTILPYQYVCAVQFASTQPVGCQINAYEWDFGDGNTSAEKYPIHAYSSSGTYTVSLQVQYACAGACVTDTTYTYELEYDPLDIVFQDTTIEIETTIKSQVISSSASTFSDAWLLQHEAEALTEKSSFVNGSEGVWRNESVYVFDAQRAASGTTNVATDGTYSLYAFDWRSAAFDMVPSWIKANTMTEYSPYSYELENRDVLGVYSSALYDYGGHLPSANGSNMRNKEMGFTSFEYLDGATTGNFIFGSESASSTLSYEVISGYGNVALVRAPISKLQGIEMVNVLALTFSDVLPLKKLGRQVFTNNPVICLQEHPSTPEWTLVVLQNSPGEVWIGSLKMNSSFAPVDIGVLDTTLAHSGRSSLKIQTSSKTFPQQILKLDSAKRYFVSAWVSVNNIQPLTPVLASDLGVVITLKRQNNTIVSQDTLSPEGPIVEGWQQLKGTFTNSINDAVVELSFRPGSGGTAWYDDVRLHPENGNMKSYVYDLKDYRLRAILDEENFGSFFYYDMEGNLYLTKKETVQGIKTLTENISYQKH